MIAALVDGQPADEVFDPEFRRWGDLAPRDRGRGRRIVAGKVVAAGPRHGLLRRCARGGDLGGGGRTGLPGRRPPGGQPRRRRRHDRRHRRSARRRPVGCIRASRPTGGTRSCSATGSRRWRRACTTRHGPPGPTAWRISQRLLRRPARASGRPGPTTRSCTPGGWATASSRASTRVTTTRTSPARRSTSWPTPGSARSSTSRPRRTGCRPTRTLVAAVAEARRLDLRHHRRPIPDLGVIDDPGYDEIVALIAVERRAGRGLRPLLGRRRSHRHGRRLPAAARRDRRRRRRRATGRAAGRHAQGRPALSRDAGAGRRPAPPADVGTKGGLISAALRRVPSVVTGSLNATTGVDPG